MYRINNALYGLTKLTGNEDKSNEIIKAEQDNVEKIKLFSKFKNYTDDLKNEYMSILNKLLFLIHYKPRLYWFKNPGEWTVKDFVDDPINTPMPIEHTSYNHDNHVRVSPILTKYIMVKKTIPEDFFG